MPKVECVCVCGSRCSVKTQLMAHSYSVECGLHGIEKMCDGGAVAVAVSDTNLVYSLYLPAVCVLDSLLVYTSHTLLAAQLE